MYFLYLFLSIFLALAVSATVWVARGAIGRRRWVRKRDKATRALPKQIQQVEQKFFEAAAASGKPRGLMWKKSSFHESAVLARDRATGDIYALVGITVAFEAIVGGDMEGVAAVDNLRCATALLEWKDNRWTTAGRVLFNLEPREAIERYTKNLDGISEISLPSR